MKKTVTATIMITALTVALAIGSFAWYKMPNNGILSTNIETQKTQFDIYFSETQSAQSSIIPAKLKKGVLNDVSGTINGTTDQVPRGRDCLPKIDSQWNYVMNTEKTEYETTSDYLVHPASVIYNQFQLHTKKTESGGPKTYKAKITYDIEYFNVDEKGGQDSNIQKFGQKDALAFNFFFLKGNGLTDEQLKSATTADTNIQNKKPIETVFAENSSSLKLVNKNNFTLSNATMTQAQVDNYRFVPSATQKIEEATGKTYYEYSFEVDKLSFNTTYYVVLESFYQIPGALVEGNLPLTGRFIIKLGVTTVKN